MTITKALTVMAMLTLPTAATAGAGGGASGGAVGASPGNSTGPTTVRPGDQPPGTAGRPNIPAPSTGSGATRDGLAPPVPRPESRIDRDGDGKADSMDTDGTSSR